MQHFIGHRTQQGTAQSAHAAGAHDDQVALVVFQNVDQGVRRVARGHLALVVQARRFNKRLGRGQRVGTGGRTHLLNDGRVMGHHKLIQGGGFLHVGQHQAALKAGLGQLNCKANRF